jgi:nitrite reductase/ring-hydroxylating ferredoxin subunit
MSLLSTLLKGRPDGMRARLRAALGGASAPSAGGAAGAPVRAAEESSLLEPGERSLSLRKEPPRDVTPPDGFEVVLHREALDPGKIVEIIIGGTSIAVANVDGSFYATANACPHAEGPLGEGVVEGCSVVCPYHGWRFDLRTGACATVPGKSVKTYPVQVVGDAVCVQL